VSEEKGLKRRDFLSMATLAIGGFISLVVGIPAVAYIIGPARRTKQEQNWIRLGAVSKVELGTPTLFKTRIERQVGWIENEEEISAYILTEDGRNFVAMSNICSHLGCRVRWIFDQGQFFCPCHNAVFSKQGDVVSGPPPSPLDQYELKVEDGQIYILGG
jgi:menaquinol-cytochrome c reductase iron-sulfur subunit